MASSASITGVFTILDRASGPMRKMEAQAAKTMAAVEGLGAALDAQKQSGFAQETEKLTRGFRNVERSGNLATRAMGSFGKETSKTKREAGGFVTAMQKIRDVAGGLMGVLGGLKFSALAAGIGVAVQAVGALAGGVVALIPRLTDLVGVLAAAPAAAGAFVQSMGTVMLALKPAMAAISAGFKEASKSTDPFQAAMEKLSPQARTFVKDVIAMRPAFQRLQNAAGIKLFPQLSASLKDISKLFPTVQRNLTATGGAVGRSISGIAGDLSSTARIGDINTIMQSQTRIAGMAGNGIRNLVSALVDFMVAAAPFSEWLFKTVEGWTEVAAASAKAGRETGGIARYLDRTRGSLELFGGILKDTWEIMMALGKAARPLGDRLWGGAARATRGWADFLKSAEGANKAREWFDSLYEPLHAMGQLAKEASVAIFGMTKDTSTLTDTANALRGAIPALAEFFTGASKAFGPSLAQGLTAVAELLNALPFSPLSEIVKAMTEMLTIVTALVKAIPGLGFVISTLLTVTLGMKLIGAVGRVGSLAAMWNAVTAAATRAGMAQQVASMGGFGRMGGRGGYTATTGPLAGMVGVGGKAGGPGGLRGLAGQFKGGGAGAGLAIGLGGGLLASALGSSIGGDAGNKVSGIGGMAATGAGLGMMAGPWGALAGGLAGALVGAIQTGLFKGGDKAKEAGKKAGEEYMKGLGISGIDPKTGRPWAPGANPYEGPKQRIAARQTAIANARKDIIGNSGMTDAQLNQWRQQAPDNSAFKALDRVEKNSVAAFVGGITAPRQGKFLDTGKFIAQDFVKQFKGVGPAAQKQGAQAIMDWVSGVRRKGGAARGVTKEVFQGIARQLPAIAREFGGTGADAMRRFNASLKENKSRSAVKNLINEIGQQWEGLKDMPAATTANWERAYNRQRRYLRGIINDSSLPKSTRNDAKQDLAAIEQQAAKTRRAVRRATEVGAPGPGRTAQPKGKGPLAPNPLFQNPFGRAPVPGITKPIQPKVNASQANANLKTFGGKAREAGNATVRMADKSKISSTRIQTHSREMAQKHKEATNQMIEDTNRVFGAIGASPQITVRAATGARLPAFASGGRIPGAPMGDHIPLYGRGGALLGIADGGELVVNRHTEKRVNGMLAQHGTSLGKEVAGERKPHFALGGRMAGQVGDGGDNHIKGRMITGGQEHIIREQGRIANSLLARTVTALNKKIDMMQPKTGLGNFQGFPVSNWIISVLKYAQNQGWGGSITSGYRSAAKQADIKANDSRAAAPGASNHNKIDYPGGAIDVGGFDAKGPGSYLNSKIGGFPGKYKLVWGGPAINDWGHFSAMGNAHGGRLPRFGGWHARGMSGTVNRPTLIGVGERGPEKVKVTPVGKAGSRGKIEVHIGNIHYSRKGDVAEAIRQEMELLSDELGMMGDNE